MSYNLQKNQTPPAKMEGPSRSTENSRESMPYIPSHMQNLTRGEYEKRREAYKKPNEPAPAEDKSVATEYETLSEEPASRPYVSPHMFQIDKTERRNRMEPYRRPAEEVEDPEKTPREESRVVSSPAPRKFVLNLTTEPEPSTGSSDASKGPYIAPHQRFINEANAKAKKRAEE
ncbi:hypothetical protein K402DRAFT_425699 [Aulographum hederae CBS 113979]|uniref:Uncharacterized protein n=1 Tax=Aulographum hederae CBS 113979 TaxID=1176131 RepID=A0A6G1GJW5_9PEZI|nr:hypothetical protein K402DRAFT_425699 [Aulographum hederae CBS 113979]